MTRPIKVHFSCGAASAVSLLIAQTLSDDVSAVYADTGGEHPDNMRFLHDMETLTGLQIKILRSEAYSSPLDVWTRKRFIKGKHGAPCTGELKRLVLKDEWTLEQDHVFGFDVDESHRLERIQENEKPFTIRSLLIERGLTKENCFQILEARGLRLPEMYALGYNNANCIGCPKGGKGYWNKIRQDFPEHFAAVATLQRSLGPNHGFWPNPDGTRLMLDQLPETAGTHAEPGIQCDMFCTDQAFQEPVT
jgi:hypothetical protein